MCDHEKDCILQVRLSHTEKRTFLDASRISGTSMSAWVRDRLKRIARDELQTSGLPVAFIDEEKRRAG